MKRIGIALLFTLITLSLAAMPLFAEEEQDPSPSDGSCHLEQVVVLSRHNIRAPLSNSGSAVGQLTPYTWTEWTAPESELTLKGGIAETIMGQYFRKWLEAEQLIPENYIPEDGEVRFYTNARQRTIATAQYFSSGMLPVANVPIEYKDEIGATDPTFKLYATFMSDAYAEAVDEQLHEQFDLEEGGEIQESLAEDYALLEDVIDFKDSEGYLSGEYPEWRTDDIEVVLEEGKEASIGGSLKTAMAASDAIVLQYYEEDDPVKAAFGHELSTEEWTQLADITTTYQTIRFNSQLIGVNLAHPMLIEILSEIQNPGRKFSFICGHDANVATVLGALGVTDYDLPETIERRTPIGVKLVFEKWAKGEEEFARIRLVYQSTEQLRHLTPLSLETPPMSFTIELPGLVMNEDGYYQLDEVTGALQNAIDSYDMLNELYADDVELEEAA